MSCVKKNSGIVLSMTLLFGLAQQAAAQYAAAVVSYDAGATPVAGFTTAAAALGEPERFTGEGLFPGVVSPFYPPYLSSEIVSVGAGGQITLRLSHYAIPQAAEPEIGVFQNIGLVDLDYPNGQAGTPATTFGDLDEAIVDVSTDGVDWVSLGSITFDVPTNGYTDLTDPFSATPGNLPSDFRQPFTGSLSSFDGLPYFDAGGPDMLDLLAGSGGGTWLDISDTGLPKVGYIRFSVANDGDAGTSLNFELDAVSISHAATGTAIVPEPTMWSLVFAAMILPALSRPQRRPPQKVAEPGRGQSRSITQRLGSNSAS